MRINLYAGPGAGKSTTAAYLFSELKRLDYSVELVSEYVKSWAISNRRVVGFDQVYLMGKQLQYEYRFVANGIEHIVTDSPVLLSACYARAYTPDLNIADSMESIIMSYETKYPSINIFLERGDKSYKCEGRYQTASEALEIDKIVLDCLDRNNLSYRAFDFKDKDGILRHCRSKIAEFFDLECSKAQ